MSDIKQNTLLHLRTIIRNKVQELLIGSVKIPEGKIFLSRPNDLWLDEVPCILIYFTEELGDKRNEAPLKLKNTLNLSIQVLTEFNIQNKGEVDTWLDSRALEIQHAMFKKQFLDLESVEEVIYAGTVPTTIKSEGKNNIETQIVRFDIRYIDELEYVFSTLDEFLKFDYTFTTENEDQNLAEGNVLIREK